MVALSRDASRARGTCSQGLDTLVPFSDCLLLVYRCTRTHSPLPPAYWCGHSFPLVRAGASGAGRGRGHGRVWGDRDRAAGTGRRRAGQVTHLLDGAREHGARRLRGGDERGGGGERDQERAGGGGGSAQRHGRGR